MREKKKKTVGTSRSVVLYFRRLQGLSATRWVFPHFVFSFPTSLWSSVYPSSHPSSHQQVEQVCVVLGRRQKRKPSSATVVERKRAPQVGDGSTRPSPRHSAGRSQTRLGSSCEVGASSSQFARQRRYTPPLASGGERTIGRRWCPEHSAANRAQPLRSSGERRALLLNLQSVASRENGVKAGFRERPSKSQAFSSSPPRKAPAPCFFKPVFTCFNQFSCRTNCIPTYRMQRRPPSLCASRLYRRVARVDRICHLFPRAHKAIVPRQETKKK